MAIKLNRWILPEESPEEGRHPLALRQPFRLLVIGASNTGKTEAALRLVLDFQIIDCLYILAKFHDTPLYDMVKKEIQRKLDQGDIKQAWISSDLRKLILPMGDVPGEASSSDMPHADPDKENFFIFDDMLNESNADRNKIGLLFTAGRHFRANVVSIFQAFKNSIPPKARSSASHLMLFPGISEGDLKEIYNTYSLFDLGKYKDFKALYVLNVTGPGKFIFIDLHSRNAPYAKYRLGMSRFFNPRNRTFVDEPRRLEDIPRILNHLKSENGASTYMGPRGIPGIEKIQEVLGEIQAGNNNPRLIDELGDLIELELSKGNLSIEKAKEIWKSVTGK